MLLHILKAHYTSLKLYEANIDTVKPDRIKIYANNENEPLTFSTKILYLLAAHKYVYVRRFLCAILYDP